MDRMKKKTTSALILLLIINILVYCGHCSRIIEPPTVKTIEKHGMIFDCVDFHKQPAFDDPLLKNHSIQRKPSKDFEISETYHQRRTERDVLTKGSEKCPEGSVPIRRVTEDDIHLDSFDPSDFSSPDCHLAILHNEDEIFKAVRGKISIHSPHCLGNQLTASYVGISDSFEASQENIYAGWVRSSQLYGDNHPHLSIFWNNKAQGKGCFDALCPGYVQVDQTVAPGNYFEHVSIFHGDGSEVAIEIRQDPQTKNWWFLKSGISVGYFPKELFSKFEEGAGGVLYGGIAIADENHVSPQMGFGLKPSGWLDESGYIRYMEFDTSTDTSLFPFTSTKKDSGCYQLLDERYSPHNDYTILFGGPGGAHCN